MARSARDRGTREVPAYIGKHKIIREIGRGATATVYLAENTDYPMPIAVKHMPFERNGKDSFASNRRLLKLLKAEGAVAGRLQHPNIIKVFDTVVEKDQAYVVMEYFPGQSLERYCRFEHLLPLHRVVGIVFKCAMALDYAFRQGIVHRDIKPANILVDDRDNVKITDFGLALNLKKKSDADSTFIMGVGSPAYMSPEQIKAYPLDQKTDLYSLGVVLFHLLTGRLPFRARNPAQLIYKIINADPPSITQLVPDLPEQLDGIVRRALEKDLYSRYKNGAEFAKDLSGVRYQILDDKLVPVNTSRFSALRKLAFFTEFEDVELWELMRISTWRTAQKSAFLMREGDTDRRFGLLLDGQVQLSVDGRKVMDLGPGDIFGESAFMDGFEHKHAFTVVALGAVSFLELIPSALALASEEVQELVNARLATESTRRLAALSRRLAAEAEPAEPGIDMSSGIEFVLDN